MPQVVKGSFTVEMKPQGDPIPTDGVSTGRMYLNKRFEGDLVAVGQGEVLTALTPVKGSAGYVASSGLPARCRAVRAASCSSTQAP